MIPRAVCLFLLPGILFGLSFQRCDADQKKYDQRQNGETNVLFHTKNLLVILGTSLKPSPGLLDILLSRSADLNRLDFKISDSKGIPKEPSDALVYETDESDEGRVPYHVEIVHMEKDKEPQANDHPDGSTGDEKEENIESGSSSKDTELLGKNLNGDASLEVAISGKKTAKKMRSLWRNEQGGSIIVDGLEKENRRSAESKNLEMENLEQSDDLPVKEDDSKAARPGMSLKKQLSKKEEKAVSSMPDERNEVNHMFHELVLLGGGIENCGPGRFRDRLGVCQDDKNFN